MASIKATKEEEFAVFGYIREAEKELFGDKKSVFRDISNICLSYYCKFVVYTLITIYMIIKLIMYTVDYYQ